MEKRISLLETALKAPTADTPDEAVLVLLASAPVPTEWYSISVFDAGGVSLRVISRNELVTADPAFARVVSGANTRHFHSGHSLTDAYTMGSWPGDIRQIRRSLFPEIAAQDTDPDLYHARVTIPGSSTEHRWEEYPQEAWSLINFDTLIITERGLDRTGVAFPGSGSDDETFLRDILHEMKWAVEAWQTGSKTNRPTEYILWTIWPYIDFVDFNEVLADYERRFKFRADYITWKMHQLFPDLPADWRAWIIPGHRFIQRLSVDIAAGNAPGFTVLHDAFEDNIHPNAVTAYGLACFAATALYQTDLRTVSGVFRPAAVTEAQATYFQRIAWEIAIAYEPVGMGGTQGTTAYWQPADGDMFPTLSTSAALLAGAWGSGIVPLGTLPFP